MIYYDSVYNSFYTSLSYVIVVVLVFALDDNLCHAGL